jgi:hypothetical protein
MSLDKLKELFPANRIAAITGFLTSILAALVALKTSFLPGSPGEEAIAKAIVITGSLLAAWKIVDKFLEGAQNWDSLLLSGQPKNSGGSLVNAQATATDNQVVDPAFPEAPGRVAAGEEFPTVPPGLQPGE